MQKQHESYKGLIWTLAKTDFTLRYHGSVLGYAWAILKPLLMFSVMYFVFSSLFNPKNSGSHFYAIELLISIIMFTFFSEASSSGMNSLLAKGQLVTKIYVPRWCIIVASTVNGLMIYCLNLFVIVLFSVIFGFMPSLGAILMFIFASISLYILILFFSLLTAPLYVRFRDLQMIWEVILQMIFYASPIIYPLSILPANIRQFVLLNPLAFLIHFTKEGFVNQHYPDPLQVGVFLLFLAVSGMISVFAYRIFSKNIAESM